MTCELNYYTTNYNFVSPIRHFKANDPYYYEVDNIPIKQLEENTNFLKEQVDGILSDRATENDQPKIDRSGFTELQPFVRGNDRKVRVRCGRYTARINDAYTADPLQFITQVVGTGYDVVNSNNNNNLTPRFDVETIAGDGVSAALNTFQNGLNGAALNMNGLAERSFTFPIPSQKGTPIPGAVGQQGTLNAKTVAEYLQARTDIGNGQSEAPLLPNFIGQLYLDATTSETQRLTLIESIFVAGAFPDASNSNKTESNFIKRWRGAIRTSVVDVSGELSVTVPDFDQQDFFYLDENGDKQLLDANQRIDLVFIYSKAIDQNQTTIAQTDGAGLNKTLTRPALGILKGAGVGVSRKGSGTPNDNVDIQSLDNIPIMLAHPGDEQGTTTGFHSSSAGVIRGSFPSPDDLMNLAPVLSEGLETDSIALIGQSILPVAYVRVTNSGGVADILETNDIIDIRPFFRTTELSYNERAGIAAATPQVSIANPVVTEEYAEKMRRELYGELRQRVNAIPIPPATPSRVVGMGTVCGGIQYGPEGALFRQAAPNLLGRPLREVTWGEMADAAENFFNYLPGSITFDPGWDPAPWSLTQTPRPGDQPADCIHVSWPIVAESTNQDKYYLPPFNKSLDNLAQTNSNVEGLRDSQTNENFPGLHGFGVKRPWFDAVAGLGGDGIYLRQNVVVTFVRKVIRINRDNVPWMTDYTVNAQLLNCIPLSSGSDTGQKRQGRAAGSSNIWINKCRDYFVINVAWVSDDFNRRTHDNDFTRIDAEGIPWANRDEVNELAGFALPEIAIPFPGDFQQYGMQLRNPAGQNSPAVGANQTQGERVLDQVNQGLAATSNRLTSVNYFTDITPVLYPTVQYEIIGHSNDMTSRSPRGGALIQGATPTIELI
tara:strand:+ start:581 stop:3244 length:2664 start_codon:yes stop_codon:yes gene_type:complete